jgi:hypothetical protein
LKKIRDIKTEKELNLYPKKKNENSATKILEITIKLKRRIKDNNIIKLIINKL